MSKKTIPYASREDVAYMLDVSTKTIQRMEVDGLPIAKTGSGARPNEYDLRQVVRWWTAREIQKATGGDYNAERTRLTKEQADKEEMANAVRRGDLLEATEVGAAWDDMILAARSKMLALPTRVTPLIQATDGEFHSIKNVIDAGVREALDELSQYPATTIDGEMEAAAETDS